MHFSDKPEQGVDFPGFLQLMQWSQPQIPAGCFRACEVQMRMVGTNFGNILAAAEQTVKHAAQSEPHGTALASWKDGNIEGAQQTPGAQMQGMQLRATCNLGPKASDPMPAARAPARKPQGALAALQPCLQLCCSSVAALQHACRVLAASLQLRADEAVPVEPVVTEELQWRQGSSVSRQSLATWTL